MLATLDYIEGLEDKKLGNLMLEAHELVRSLIPQVQPVIKWKIPFFDYYGHYFCYLHKTKKSIYLAFLNKPELVSETIDIERLKVVSKVYSDNHELLRSDALAELIVQAAVLHEERYRK